MHPLVLTILFKCKKVKKAVHVSTLVGACRGVWCIDLRQHIGLKSGRKHSVAKNGWLMKLLPLDAAHVWSTTHAQAVTAAHLALLDDNERARHGRFVFPADRQSFALSHVLLRRTLAHFLEVPAAALRFATEAHGKPTLVYPKVPHLFFNLSHTRAISLCAVAPCAVGVDVELTTRTVGADLAQRYFAAAEVQALQALPEAARQARFFTLWTLKEAYLKATGVGLAQGLHTFAFAIADAEPPTIRLQAAHEQTDAWQFAAALLSPEAAWAIALKRGMRADLPIRFTTLSAI